MTFGVKLSLEMSHLPGDLYPTDAPGPFLVEVGRCWRMVYSEQLQAAHCTVAPAWTGRHRSPKGDGWWIVWSCDQHADGLTALRRV